MDRALLLWQVLDLLRQYAWARQWWALSDPAWRSAELAWADHNGVEPTVMA